jgi:hypothetical protein
MRALRSFILTLLAIIALPVLAIAYDAASGGPDWIDDPVPAISPTMTTDRSTTVVTTPPRIRVSETRRSNYR